MLNNVILKSMVPLKTQEKLDVEVYSGEEKKRRRREERERERGVERGVCVPYWCMLPFFLGVQWSMLIFFLCVEEGE